MHHKVFDERTGDPSWDNEARNWNRSVNRSCRNRLTVKTPRGRRRKKAILHAEYPRYVELVAALAAGQL